MQGNIFFHGITSNVCNLVVPKDNFFLIKEDENTLYILNKQPDICED